MEPDAKDESMNIRYLLCNADEMEPGTYKDRLLMEQLPHLLVEGMLISALALKAYRGYIFLRGEYIEAAENLRRAIAEATEAGLLGKTFSAPGLTSSCSCTPVQGVISAVKRPR